MVRISCGIHGMRRKPCWAVVSSRFPRAPLLASVVWAGGLAWGGGGCVAGPGSDDPLPAADFPAFVATVQPVLAERCGPSSCHGSSQRALEVFVAPNHRMDGVAPGSPLTDEELRAGFDRARGLVVGAEEPLDSPLLSEPLAVAAGGSRHDPGPVFLSEIDDEYLALRDWVADAIAASEVP